jgi:MFS family permease
MTAGRRECIGLAVLTLPCLLYAMDLTVLNLAVPHISKDLRPSSTQLLWIVDSYGFLAAAFTAALTTNLLSFFVGSAPCCTSPSTCNWRWACRRWRQACGCCLPRPGSSSGLGSAAGLGVLVTGSAVFSLALAPVDTFATDLAVGAAPPERAGAASALSETSAEFGGALCIAILGVIGTGIYRGEVAGALPPGTPPAAAAAARDTLGGAVAAAGQLPAKPGRMLLGVARQAFTQGLHVAFAACAATVLAAAILAAVQLRHLRPRSEPGSGSPAEDAASGHVGR